MSKMKQISGDKLVVGVTAGTSAFSFLNGQLAWFQREGWHVTLVSNPDEKAHLAARREGVDFEGIPMSREIALLKDLRALTEWISFLKRHQPEAINVGTPKAGLLGMLAAWLTRVPRRLYTVRGLRIEGASGPLSWLLWGMEWLTMQLATDVLFVSKSLAEEAERRGLLPKRKSWIIGAGSSNGINAREVSDRSRKVNPDALRTSLGFGVSDFIVGFVGRITRDKGIDTLVEAFRDPHLDREIRGLLIGSVEEPSLVEEIRSLGARITVVPWTDDVWGYLPVMDVLCLPTLREGFPNVILEAAAAGVPAITTRATGAIDSVVPGVTGHLIDVGDDFALVAKLNEHSSDRSLGPKLGLAARDRVYNEFYQERIWVGLAEILQANPNPVEASRI